MKAAGRGANATMTVDLESQEITNPDGGAIAFDVDIHEAERRLARSGNRARQEDRARARSVKRPSGRVEIP